MTSGGDAERFEILEHTADIGLRARGGTLEEVFENAARGLADILDRRATGPGPGEPERLPVELDAGDREGLLVAWLDEVLFALQEQDRCLSDVRVHEVRSAIRAEVLLAACPGEPEGTELKGATYHQLAIGEDGEGFWATAYFDV